jgi:DNA (cytosine-5)-methyltransferase 1
MNRTPPLTVAEYFAGVGLVRMGLEPQGWQVVWANDISPKKHEMYLTFFPDSESHYIVDDIFDVPASDVPRTTLATCSFPCINLSLAGNMEGISGEHSSAFWGFVNILKAQSDSGVAPPLILVENVPGWLYSNNGNDFRITVQALNDLGYACDVFTLDARRFTPQSRLRVFLIGIMSSDLDSEVSSILSRPQSLLPKRLRLAVFENQELDWFCTPLPNPPKLKKQGLSEIVEQMSDNDNRWWSIEEVTRHLEMMDVSHRERVEHFIQEETTTYRTFYRRIRKKQQRAEVRHDDVAGCLRTAVGGSGKQFIIKAGNGEIKMRTMTPREYARLQGVPDKYPINTNEVQALTGFGDAVCVPVISWIAKYALNPLVDKYFQELRFLTVP